MDGGEREGCVCVVAEDERRVGVRKKSRLKDAHLLLHLHEDLSCMIGASEKKNTKKKIDANLF